MDRWREIVLACVLATLLGACSANHHSIFRNRSLTPPAIVTVDAKQRAYLVAPGASASPDAMRICAEPAPDVFSVLAQSLGISGTFGQAANPASTQVAASLAGSSAEQGSTIPRTQTINMLREAMYRTCERYLNRGIGELELPIQAIRDQRMMVSILAIEQLTGAVAPNAVVIGASGSAEAGTSGVEAVPVMNDAWRAVQAADEAVTTRQAAYDELQGADRTCETLLRRSGDGETLNAGDTTKLGQCNERLGALNAAKTRRQDAAQHYEALRTASLLVGAPASAETNVQDRNNVGGGGLSRADAQSVERVANTVETIVRLAYDQDEFLLFCIRALDSRTQPPPHPAEQAHCRAYVNAQLQRETAQAQFEARNFQAAMTAIVTSDASNFQMFWQQVAPGGTLDPQRLRTEIDAYITSYTQTRGFSPPDIGDLTRLRSATDEPSARREFSLISDEARQALAR